MIPKIIHYCWFGKNTLPDLAKKCIQSWKKNCPDYEIIEWNEDNFNLGECQYAFEAYKEKKWAFVTDYVRLKVLYEYGGIYMDTDVEIIKPLDSLLEYKAVSGFESETNIPTGLIAAEKNNPFIYELLKDYFDIHFILPDGKCDLTTNVVRITKKCLKYGLVQNNTKQTIAGFTLLPSEYLCPKNPKTGKINMTGNTITIHHFDGSWLTEEQKYIYELGLKMKKYLPYYFATFFSYLVGFVRYRGLKCGITELIRTVKTKLNQ